LESIACGTPVVSFGVGVVKDLVRPGITGFVADSEDPIDLAARVVEFFADTAKATALSEQCRQVALAEYCIGTQVRRYHEIYQLEIELRN